LLLLITASIKAKIAAKINFQAENRETIKRHLQDNNAPIYPLYIHYYLPIYSQAGQAIINLQMARSGGIAVAVVVGFKKIWLRAKWILWSPRERYAYLRARVISYS